MQVLSNSILRIAGLVAVTFIIAICLLFAYSSRPNPQPFVFFITIDTVGAKHLGLYGNYIEHQGQMIDTMPFLSELAKDSVVFDNAVTVASQSAPSHASMFTSVHPIKLGMYKNGIPLGTAWPVISKILGKEGYRTYGLPNTVVLGPQVAGFHQGFNEFYVIDHINQFDESDIPARSYRKTIELLDNHLKHRPDQPAYFWLHNDYAHGPYRHPRKWRKNFKIKGQRLYPVVDLKKLHTQGKLPSKKQLEALKIHHYRSLRFIDDMLKEFIKKLTQLEVLERSLIIIVADHGETFEAGSTGGHSGILTEEIIRIPLIFRFPNREYAGTRIKELVDQRDILPTILHYMRVLVPETAEGRSLIPMMQGQKVWQPHTVVTVASPLRIYSARNSFYKLIEKGQKEGLKNHAEVYPFLEQNTLYDLATNQAIDLTKLPDLGPVKMQLENSINSVKEQSSSVTQRLSSSVLKMLYESGYLDPDDKLE